MTGDEPLTYERLDELIDLDPIELRDVAWAEIRELRARVERLTDALHAIRSVLIDDGDGAGPGAMFSMIRRYCDSALGEVGE